MGAFEPGTVIVVNCSETTGDFIFDTELPIAESVTT